MWRNGKISVNGQVYEYWMKVFEGGSVFGINEGPVSKLQVRREDMLVANYDRGWDLEPVDPGTALVVELLVHNASA